MAGSASVPNQFQTQNGPIPLSQLDNNFTSLLTPINTLANYSNYYVDSSGAANTLTIAVPGPQVVSYVAGLRLDVKLSNTNTSQTVNINVNGLGNQAVQNADGSQVAIGQLVAGQILSMIYNGTAFTLNGAQSSSSTSILPFTKTSAGNVTLPAPASGNALTISAVSGFVALNLAGALVTGNSFGLSISAGTNSIDYPFLLTNAANTLQFGKVAGDGSFFFGHSSAGSTILTASPAGNITIAAPASGVAMSISGVGTSDVIDLGSSSGNPANQGFVINGATQGSVGFAGAANQLVSGSVSGDMILRTSGGRILFTTNTGTSSVSFVDSSGSLNGFNGVNSGPIYSGVPQNLIGGAYTTVLADANKHIKQTAAATITIAANASVAYPLGTVITFVNRTVGNISIAINSDTLQWSQNNTGGTRTLAAAGMATAIKVDSTLWLISGAGLS